MATASPTSSPADFVLDVLRRRTWIGLIAFVVVFSAAVPLPVFLPDVYRSRATVLVERQDVPANLVRFSVAELDTRLIMIRQEILSRARLLELVERFNLYPDLHAAPADAIVYRMRQDITVEFTGTDQARTGRPSTIGVTIGYVGLDPHTTTNVANALADAYVAENTDMRTRQAGRTAGFLKSELEAAERELARQQARLNEFKSRYAEQLPQQVTANLATLERLNLQLSLNNEHQFRAVDRRDTLVKNLADAEAAAHAARQPEPDPELIKFKNRLSELQTAGYTDRHPEMIYVKSKIAELEERGPSGKTGGAAPSPAQSAERLRRDLADIEAELAKLETEDKRLREQIASLDRRISATPHLEQQLDDLMDQYTTAKKTYDSLLTRYDEAQLAESFEQTQTGETFRVLDRALPANLPAAPNRVRLLVLVFLFAVAASVGAILLSEQLDTALHSVDDLRQFTTVPVLASIPYIRTPASVCASMLRSALTMSAVVASCAVLAWASAYLARTNEQLAWFIARSQL